MEMGQFEKKVQKKIKSVILRKEEVAVRYTYGLICVLPIFKPLDCLEFYFLQKLLMAVGAFFRGG